MTKNQRQQSRSQDHLPTHQWWADAWRGIGDRSTQADDTDYAEHCYYLADQNQNAANRHS